MSLAPEARDEPKTSSGEKLKGNVMVNDKGLLEIDFESVRCGVCQKKEATHCCDFVVDYRPPMFDEFKSALELRAQRMWGDGGVQHELCDYPLCKDCSKKNSNYLGVDFCPYHAFGEMHSERKPSNYAKKRSDWLEQTLKDME